MKTQTLLKHTESEINKNASSLYKLNPATAYLEDRKVAKQDHATGGCSLACDVVEKRRAIRLREALQLLAKIVLSLDPCLGAKCLCLEVRLQSDERINITLADLSSQTFVY